MGRRISWVAVVLAAWSHSCSGGNLPADEGAASLGAGTEAGTSAGTEAGTVNGDGTPTADGPCAPGQWDSVEWDAACWD